MQHGIHALKKLWMVQGSGQHRASLLTGPIFLSAPPLVRPATESAGQIFASGSKRRTHTKHVSEKRATIVQCNASIWRISGFEKIAYGIRYDVAMGQALSSIAQRTAKCRV